MLWDPGDFSQFYFVGELDFVGGFEWSSQTDYFVHDTTCGPDVAFVVVSLLVDLLWRHIVRSSNMSVCENRLVTHDLTKSKVP